VLKTKVNKVIGNNNDNAQITANMNVVHNILNSNVEAKIVPSNKVELAMAA